MRHRMFGKQCAGISLSAGVCILLLLLMSGCSKSVPKCDDGKTIKAVINAVSQDFRKQLSGIAGIQSGMELSDDEWKLLRSGMIIDLENTREQNFDKDAGQRTCAANLMIVQGGKKELTPITYVAMTQEGSDELRVTISGLDNYGKESEGDPPQGMKEGEEGQ
jgi:hypothetical protein